MSDLHLDTYPDRGHAFIEALPAGQADVCVLAGDITTARFPDDLRWIYSDLAARYEHVLHVPGNHEYYGTTPDRAHRSMELAEAHATGPGRIWTITEPEHVTIDGVTFFGGTLWFRDEPSNAGYKHWMNDFRYIQDFEPWVYEQQAAFCRELNDFRYVQDFKPWVYGELNERKDLLGPQVIVSHHLPHWASVDPFYRTSPLNRFFVCDMADTIRELQPVYWFHGHTHAPVDVLVDDTKILANPRGYPRERDHGPGGYHPLLIEVND